ncbi:nickel-dependent lactate racemase family protein [Candidatus Laterigemmans baculatus]|uniref:hypothetical protein n=1 Tax=Candidatus Laterigemmans baculatus TaxID=2770505 RepID=UPI0013DA4FD8|nr:hypothetical protein [Candidatus Laterigemmans baculatus]
MRIGIGHAETVELPPAGAMEMWEFHPDRGRRIDAVREVARRAAARPEDYPPLAEAIVDGDAVALAVDPNVPHVAEVVAGIVDTLPRERIGSLSVVLSEEAQEATAEQLRQILAGLGEIEVTIHDPADRESLGYLAANTAADPIYLNRRLLDADLVLPIITARPAGSLDPANFDGGVFPAFADGETQRRLRGETIDAAGQDDREAAEAAWLLGLQVLVAVVPTADAHVARVLVGTPGGIRRAAEHQVEAGWQRDVSRKASLVFACIDGGPQQQTWDNVARALHVARHLVRPGGTIVVTSRLGERTEKSLRRLAGTETYEAMLQRIKKDRGRHALAASLLLQLRQEGRVLLMSDLPAGEIEALGIGAVESTDQLLRLVESHDSCAIIRSAQFCGIGTLP